MLNSGRTGQWGDRGARVGYGARPGRARRSPLVVIATVVLSLGVTALCAFGCLGLGVVGLIGASGIVEDEAEAVYVVDSYLAAMRDKDARTAFAYLSPTGQRKTPLATLQKEMTGEAALFYVNYEDIEVTSFSPIRGSKLRSYRLECKLLYRNDAPGSCVAVMNHEGSDWTLDSIEITRDRPKPGATPRATAAPARRG